MSRTRLVLLFVTSLGCVGTVGDAENPAEEPAPSTPGQPNTGTPSGNEKPGQSTGGSVTLPGTPSSGGCQESAPLVTAARRLTRDQYVNTVRDLLGSATDVVGDVLPKDDVGDNLFVDARTLIVSPDWASSAMDAAEAAAKAAVANIKTLMPCDPASGEQACLDKFITSFGKRAYRRPLEPDEVSGLKAVHAAGAKNGGFDHGIEVVVRAMLQSASFLYRVELGQKQGSAGGSVRLRGHEVASRLSYLFWNTMPDKDLMDAADGGKLESDTQVVAQARRLLADPRAHKMLGEFHGKWLGIDGVNDVAKDPDHYPEWNPEMITAMRTELDMVLDEILFKGDGRFESLFDANFSFVDARLATLYKLPAPGGAGFARVELNPAERKGVLTNVGVITAHTFADESAPIHRGKFIRENFLCTIPPDPPAELMVEPPQPKPGVSTRERLAEHTEVPACRGCHTLMDPIGHGFEAFDGMGRHRVMDPSGKPVDDRGVLEGTEAIDGPFKGVLELSQKLAGSKQVRDCLVSNALKFAQGLDAASDTCVRSKVTAAFDGAKHDLRELFIAITSTDGFRYRRAIEGEVLQ